LPPVSYPVSTKSSAQKLIKFKENFAVAYFGSSFVNKKSILSQVKSLENNIRDEISSVDVVADKVFYHFEKELKKDIQDLSKLPDHVVPFGFQVVGFDANGVGKTWVIHMGKKPTKAAETELGVTYSGDIQLLQRLFGQDPSFPDPRPNLLSYSLQDAVDYAKFLIRFVADYQRFANMIPTVGGDIDVALVTNYSGLKWIERKPISKVLED